jgi:hypothetical protein
MAKLRPELKEKKQKERKEKKRRRSQYGWKDVAVDAEIQLHDQCSVLILTLGLLKQSGKSTENLGNPEDSSKEKP